MTRERIRLGDLLLERKLISEQNLKDALTEQRNTGRKLGRVLVDIGAISDVELHRALAEYLDIPYVDLAHMSLDAKIVRLLSETHARRYRALVLRDDKSGLLVGMADPTDIFAFDELSRVLGRPVRLALVQESALLRTIDIVYRRTDEIVSLAEELDEELSLADVNLDTLSADDGSPDAPVIKLIQSMFHDAVRVSASDIHIEPEENILRIRLRVDGMLQEQIIDGHRVGQALVTRLKLMCGLDIAEKRKPQDGRFSIKISDKSLDVRVSTMPIYGGEAIVLRLLDQAGHMSFDELGMPDDVIERFTAIVERAAGLVLVTGPTGSGKTTTLYAALNHVNSPQTKIITAEDPVEYRLERVNQVQVNPRIGLDFAAVLRTALRQDPDVVLVGEMRDRETVEIGMRAAMTGHLVFSTVHTINAIATVHRLLDMGAEGFLIGSALSAVLAQRLIRRVCSSCSSPAELSPQQRVWVDAHRPHPAIDERTEFHVGTGCTYCNMTGYSGRVGIYELLEIDGPLADAIRREDLPQFTALAKRQSGYVSLVGRALGFAAARVTSIEEIMRVTAGLEVRDAGKQLLEDLDSETRLRGSA
ncbi:MAG TPA: GspE/PulE family protein [Gammaproteobacteria bacterium]|nr:GspE/PulE family protein [Gammaproteobacteria bacterium]